MRRFDPKRLTGHPLERSRVARCGPELELRVAVGADLQQIIIPTVMELQTAHDLRVAAVEALRKPQDRGQRAHGAPRSAFQPGKSLV